MDIAYIRDRVANCPKYTSVKWRNKVFHMRDDQVYAIDRNFAKKGLYGPHKGIVEYQQITLYDIFPEIMKGEANEPKQKSENSPV